MSGLAEFEGGASDQHEPIRIPSFLTLACSSVRKGAITDSALLVFESTVSSPPPADR